MQLSPRSQGRAVLANKSSHFHSSASFARAASNIRKALGAFSRLPPSETWLRSGNVERQTLTSDLNWLPRLMVLTPESIFFAKEGSDTILDKLPLKHVVFIGKVEVAKDSIGNVNSNKLSLAPMSKLVTGRRSSNESLKSPEIPHGRRKSLLSSPFSRDCIQDLQSGSQGYVFEIRVSLKNEDGDPRHVVERSHFTRVESSAEGEAWIADIRAALSHLERAKWAVGGRVWRAQRAAQQACSSRAWRASVAVAIAVDFLVSVMQAEYLPEAASSGGQTLAAVLEILNVFFLVELLVTGFAQWRSRWGHPFVSSPWNWYHAATVIFQLVSYGEPGLIVFTRVRMIRIFHVASMFKAFVSFKIIMTALSHATVPVLAAVVILIFVTCIAAVFGVHLFGSTDQWNFGNFSLALFTMFQVATGDGWAPYVTRPLAGNIFPNLLSGVATNGTAAGMRTVRAMDGWDSLDAAAGLLAATDSSAAAAAAAVGVAPTIRRAVCLFFVVFYFMAGIGLLGIVHATLLDEFMNVVQKERAAFQMREMEGRYMTAEKVTSPLDPLLSSLAHFNSSLDLTARLEDLFNMLDENSNGTLNYAEIKNGLEGLSTPITLSLEDLDAMTDNKGLCNINGELDRAGFVHMMRSQLQLFFQRTLAASLEQIERQKPAVGSLQEHLGTILFVLKLLLANMDDHSRHRPPSGPSPASEACCGTGGICGSAEQKLDEVLRLLRRPSLGSGNIRGDAGGDKDGRQDMASAEQPGQRPPAPCGGVGWSGTAVAGRRLPPLPLTELGEEVQPVAFRSCAGAVVGGGAAAVGGGPSAGNGWASASAGAAAAGHLSPQSEPGSKVDACGIAEGPPSRDRGESAAHMGRGAAGSDNVVGAVPTCLAAGLTVSACGNSGSQAQLARAAEDFPVADKPPTPALSAGPTPRFRLSDACATRPGNEGGGRSARGDGGGRPEAVLATGALAVGAEIVFERRATDMESLDRRAGPARQLRAALHHQRSPDRPRPIPSTPPRWQPRALRPSRAAATTAPSAAPQVLATALSSARIGAAAAARAPSHVPSTALPYCAGVLPTEDAGQPSPPLWPGRPGPVLVGIGGANGPRLAAVPWNMGGGQGVALAGAGGSWREWGSASASGRRASAGSTAKPPPFAPPSPPPYATPRRSPEQSTSGPTSPPPPPPPLGVGDQWLTRPAARLRSEAGGRSGA